LIGKSNFGCDFGVWRLFVPRIRVSFGSSAQSFGHYNPQVRGFGGGA